MSMFEEPDFGRAQTPAAGEDSFDDDVEDLEDDDLDELEDEDDVDDVVGSDDIAAEDDEDDDVEDEEEEFADDAEDDGVLGASVPDDGDGDEVDDVDESVNRVRGGAAKAVLEHVAQMLVDDPDSVIVDVSEGRSGWRFSVHVAQGDMGRLIGRKGRTAQAIRTLVRAAAASEGTEASVDIVD